MKIGCHLPTTQPPDLQRDALVTFAREAEARGIDSLWVSDHVIIPRETTGYGRGGTFPHPPERPYFEPTTMLAAAAMVTERAQLGASVFILGHRHPVVMAKMLASIDGLSGGRLICGVGVGWWKQELETLGVPFHARGRHADEVLKVWKTLWTDERPAFEGEFFRVRDVGFAPKPVRKPHPPIWVGGDSPGAFRRVVTLGDGWHSTTKTPEQVRDALGRLRVAADAAGRRFETIALSLRFTLSDEWLARGPQAVVDVVGEYARLGMGHVLLEFRREDGKRMLEILDLVATKIRPAVTAA